MNIRKESDEYISVRHLSKKFDGDYVLKDVSAVLRKGEILGFLGPSGAGKTTTINILTGQLLPTSGSAEVLGIGCDKIDEKIYEQIGIVTDSSGIYERMSVYDNLKYFARLLNAPIENIDPLLKRIGLYEHRKKTAGKLRKARRSVLSLRAQYSINRRYCFWMNLQAGWTRPRRWRSTGCFWR